jgi:hypothetical protein
MTWSINEGIAEMANVIVTHGVGNMDAWLKGGAERERLFAPFCSSYRIYRQQESNRVAIASENVDLEKMQAAIATHEMQAATEKHTVLLPVEVYVEIPGGK